MKGSSKKVPILIWARHLQNHNNAASKHFREKGKSDGKVVLRDEGGEFAENQDDWKYAGISLLSSHDVDIYDDVGVGDFRSE